MAKKARPPTALAEAHYQQLEGFLARIATALGAFVGQRLQETPPYY